MLKNPVLAQIVKLFETIDVPFPPIPEACANSLVMQDQALFATDNVAKVPVANIMSTNLLDELMRGIEPADSLLVLGLVASGLQSNTFRYIFANARLGFGILLPFGNAYADADEERKNVTLALQLAEICLRATKGGTSFGHNEDAKLLWTLDALGVNFAVTHSSGETLLEGAGVELFMDFLQTCLDGDAPASTWLSV